MSKFSDFFDSIVKRKKGWVFVFSLILFIGYSMGMLLLTIVPLLYPKYHTVTAQIKCEKIDSSKTDSPSSDNLNDTETTASNAKTFPGYSQTISSYIRAISSGYYRSPKVRVNKSRRIDNEFVKYRYNSQFVRRDKTESTGYFNIICTDSTKNLLSKITIKYDYMTVRLNMYRDPDKGVTPHDTTLFIYSPHSYNIYNINTSRDIEEAIYIKVSCDSIFRIDKLSEACVGDNFECPIGALGNVTLSYALKIPNSRIPLLEFVGASKFEVQFVHNVILFMLFILLLLSSKIYFKDRSNQDGDSKSGSFNIDVQYREDTHTQSKEYGK